MANVQEKAMWVPRFFETKSVIKTRRLYRTQYRLLWRYVKDIVYKTPVTSLDELKLRIVAAIERVTPQMPENTWTSYVS
jgi:hypothetical protein